MRRPALRIRKVTLYVRPIGSSEPFRPQEFRTYTTSAARSYFNAYLFARSRYEVKRKEDLH